ncbi:hypothetical protein [Acetatifactor aquisgranensis]
MAEFHHSTFPAILITAIFYSLHHAGFQPEFTKLFFVGILYVTVFYFTHNIFSIFPFFGWYDSIGREQTKTATELAYAEVIGCNKKNLERHGKFLKKDGLYQRLLTVRQQRQGGFQPVHHHRMDNGFRNVYRFINNEIKHIPLAVCKSLQLQQVVVRVNRADKL